MLDVIELIQVTRENEYRAQEQMGQGDGSVKRGTVWRITGNCQPSFDVRINR